MRLIDADALKRYIDCGHLRSPIEKCFSELDVVQMLDKRPTIDAVPVVRCVDCKYRCTLVCPMYHTETCLDDLDGFDDCDVDRTDADGFCHLGERWDGEAE